jgi:hypothetical protein
LSIWVEGSTTSKTDVSLLSPGGSPRVLDLPVVTSVGGISSVSNDEDTVVQSSSAGRGHDTASVELEDILVSLNGDGDWLLDSGSLEGSLRVGWDVSESSDGGDGLASGLASSIGSSVWVRSLRADTLVVDDELESVIHQTTVAALVSFSSRAVNQLLLRERQELSSVDEDVSFSRSSGGEGPARSALSLVLDWGDGSGGFPIDRGWEGREVELQLIGDVDRSLLLGTVSSGITSGELISSEVSELVDTHGPGESLGVVGIDLGDVGGEDGTSGGSLLLGVGLSVLLCPGREGLKEKKGNKMEFNNMNR